MSWNQGYGNGQGEDVYGRLNNTRDVGGARFPFIEAGTHLLALCTLEEFAHRTDGPCARALFEVLRSTSHKNGEYVVKIWKLVKPSKYDTQPSDADMFADFCRKLKGAPVGYPIGNDIRVLMKERPAEQLARGTTIECVGVMNKKGTWVNIYWNAVLQAPEQIAQVRAQLEAKGIPTASVAPQAQAATPYTPAPAPAAAPAPVQPMQQYVPQGGNGGTGKW